MVDQSRWQAKLIAAQLWPLLSRRNRWMILHVRQRENSKRGFLKMKIKVLFLLVTTILNASGATIDTAQIDRLTGLKGKLNEKEGAYKISFIREDVTVFVDGWKIPAFMGLSTWAAFTKATHSEDMVTG